MKILDIRDKLHKVLTIEQRKIADRLASGSAADWSAYKQSVGRIQGIQDGINAVDEVFRGLTEEDDE